MKTTTTRPTKRKPSRFGASAKTAVSMVAAAALLGGWNLVAHLDNAQADTQADPLTTLSSTSLTVAPVAAIQSRTTPRALPTLAPLTIAPVPTLKIAPGCVQPADAAAGVAALALPDLPALAALPTLAPLPSMPNLPPPPPPSSSGDGSNHGNAGGVSSGGS